MSLQPKFASAAISSKGQTVEHINHLVADILRRGGCLGCGRIALLRVEFQSDPPAELAKLNVTSFMENGLSAG